MPNRIAAGRHVGHAFGIPPPPRQCMKLAGEQRLNVRRVAMSTSQARDRIVRCFTSSASRLNSVTSPSVSTATLIDRQQARRMRSRRPLRHRMQLRHKQQRLNLRKPQTAPPAQRQTPRPTSVHTQHRFPSPGKGPAPSNSHKKTRRSATGLRALPQRSRQQRRQPQPTTKPQDRAAVSDA
jgi:hypothetical protein